MKMDQYAVRLTEFVLRRRWGVMLMTLVMVLLLTSGGRYLYFDNNYRVFFGKDNPQLQAFDHLQEVYTKTDNVVFVIKPKTGDIFQNQVLEAVQFLTEASWQLPYSARVDSLTNFQHTYADGDDLTVVDLVEPSAAELSEQQLQAIREIALNEPLLIKRVVAEDGNAAGVNITFVMPEKSVEEVPEVAAAVRELLANVQERYPDITFVASGVVMMNNAFAESAQSDLFTLSPIMYGVLIVAMLVFYRSVWAVLATVLVIVFSAMVAMGCAGFMRIGLTPPSAGAVTTILTLAIADSVHVIISMLKEMEKGKERHYAIVESLRINFQPIFLTSITTAIGFLSLNFSDAPPFHDYGNIVATGVMVAFVLSVTFLPACLSVLPIRVTLRKENHSLAERIGDFVIGRYRSLLFFSLAIIAALAVMIPRIELNDQFVQYFDHEIGFRGDTEFMMEHLTGIYQFEYSLSGENAGGVSDPLYLETVEEFANWLRAQPEVQHVYSVTDIFKRLNKNMHGDDPVWYRLPDSRELAAQYLLLYEFSLPYRLDLNDRINIDKSAARLTATLHDLSTVQVRELKDRGEAWLKNNAPPYMWTETTSPMVMFSYISQRNIDSMVKGNIVALILISFVILLVLKNIRIGLFSLVPNLVPAIMGFGIWAIFIGQINMAVSFVIAVSLGIIVDDSVHFLSKYLRARREKGADAKEAVAYAFSHVGTALMVTTAVLVCGFSVLMLSHFQVNNFLGMLTAIIIICALAADFFLLPSLLIAGDRKHEEAGKKSAAVKRTAA